MNNKYLVHPPASLAPIIISAPPQNDNGIDTPLTVPSSPKLVFPKTHDIWCVGALP
jgi:hypothetical protein